jgi:phosphohistidine phosphatase
MTYVLYLVRHGIAEEATPDGDDAERALTGEGRKRMKDVARGLRQSGVAFDLIVTSPLRRARETADILHAELAPETKVRVFDALENGHSAEEVLRGLPHGRAHAIALVGHQPSLGELASYLVTGSPSLVPLPFKKGGVAAISVASLPPRVPGTLEWFLTPKQLRGLA